MCAWLASRRSAVGPMSGRSSASVAALTMYCRVQTIWTSQSLRIASWKTARSILGPSALAASAGGATEAARATTAMERTAPLRTPRRLDRVMANSLKVDARASVLRSLGRLVGSGGGEHPPSSGGEDSDAALHLAWVEGTQVGEGACRRERPGHGFARLHDEGRVAVEGDVVGELVMVRPRDGRADFDFDGRWLEPIGLGQVDRRGRDRRGRIGRPLGRGAGTRSEEH